MPSGAHSGDIHRLPLPFVICVVSPVATSSVQRLSPPLRSDTKTIFAPSGLKRGCVSNAIPSVIRVAVPPSMGSVNRSPSMSKTSERPSGLTSSESQEPSSVSRRTERAASSGRLPFSA